MNYKRLLQKTKTIYPTADDFLRDAVGYFNWCEEHPLLEEVVNFHKGEISRAHKDKVRPFTKKGMCIHLGIPTSRLDSYKRREGFSEAIEIIEEVIYTQKFENAASGLLNATIISRDLGLAEKQEIAGIKDAPPIGLTINPIATGTFLPLEEEAPAETE